MDTISIVFLVASCTVSFALGRTFLHFRNKKRQAHQHQALQRLAQAKRNAPPEAASKNKAKRKRQLLQQAHRQAVRPLKQPNE